MHQRIKIGKETENHGAMNFSYLLDAPAGKHGFIKAKDGHLYFEDGVRGKFVGFNMPARANMPDHRTAEILSGRLASMGVNIVRIHAIDAVTREKGWSCRPGYSVIDYDRGNSCHLNPSGLERLDYWFFCLKQKGIYIHMDLLVARLFTKGDGLDYEGGPVWFKFASHVNRRLIELQKEYASELLCHVNPYTGLAYKDDPAIVTVQIANEDSAFFTFQKITQKDARFPYLMEIQEQFNRFLLAKYDSRENLEKAWTFEDSCGLASDEDPETLSVRIPDMGELTQSFSHPMDEWQGIGCPARYADFTAFLAKINRDYYREMIDHLRGLGIKVPINTSNMSVGAADIASSLDADVMENNAYFNHPCSGPDQDHYLYSPYMREYVSTDPRKASFPSMEPRSNIITQILPTHIKGKPFIMTEWNEYGEYPFHASAFVSTAVYACFHDLDGLILYTYHTTDDLNQDKEDEIHDIMDAFNDPSLILQFGTMASVFLQGLAKKAAHMIDIVYTKNDLTSFPKTHRMPFSFLPFVTGVQCVYQQTDRYEGEADAAVSAGFSASGDFSAAKHGILYAYTPYRSAYRRDYVGETFFKHHPDEKEEQLASGVTLGERFLKASSAEYLYSGFDFSPFASYADAALKRWKILEENQGIDDKNAMISDTGEIRFSPEESRFTFEGEKCAFLAGAPMRQWHPSERFCFLIRNDRIAVSLLSLDGENLNHTGHVLISAVGRSGMDRAVYEKLPDSDTFTETDVTRISKEGKLYMETLEGSLIVKTGCSVRAYALDVYGNRIGELEIEEKSETMVKDKKICFNGGFFGNFELCIMD